MRRSDGRVSPGERANLIDIWNLVLGKSVWSWKKWITSLFKVDGLLWKDFDHCQWGPVVLVLLFYISEMQ